jgi:RNA-directed DNA polymerase
VALSVLDEYIAHAPGGPALTQTERAQRRRHGLPNYRLIRYADDWCLTVAGSQALREEIAGVLATMGLRLSQAETLITHIDDGLDFLGRICNAAVSEAPTGTTSTPTHPARPSRP